MTEMNRGERKGKGKKIWSGAPIEKRTPAPTSTRTHTSQDRAVDARERTHASVKVGRTENGKETRRAVQTPSATETQNTKKGSEATAQEKTTQHINTAEGDGERHTHTHTPNQTRKAAKEKRRTKKAVKGKKKRASSQKKPT